MQIKNIRSFETAKKAKEITKCIEKFIHLPLPHCAHARTHAHTNTCCYIYNSIVSPAKCLLHHVLYTLCCTENFNVQVRGKIWEENFYEWNGTKWYNAVAMLCMLMLVFFVVLCSISTTFSVLKKLVSNYVYTLLRLLLLLLLLPLWLLRLSFLLLFRNFCCCCC